MRVRHWGSRKNHIISGERAGKEGMGWLNSKLLADEW